MTAGGDGGGGEGAAGRVAPGGVGGGGGGDGGGGEGGGGGGGGGKAMAVVATAEEEAAMEAAAPQWKPSQRTWFCGPPSDRYCTQRASPPSPGGSRRHPVRRSQGTHPAERCIRPNTPC